MLDAIGLIRKNLLEVDRLALEKLIETLRRDDWNAPPDVINGESHISSMALAEMQTETSFLPWQTGY